MDNEVLELDLRQDYKGIRDNLFTKYIELVNLFPHYGLNPLNIDLYCKNISETFFAGGCIASLLLEQEVNDYDTYFKSNISKGNIKNKFKYEPHLKKLIEIESSRAILLKNRVQLIWLMYGQPEEIVQTFDFYHTQAWWDPEQINKIFFTNELALKAIKDKQLIFNASKYPLIAVKRVEKFLNRGFEIKQEEKDKLTNELKRLYIGFDNVEPLRQKLLWVNDIIDEFYKNDFTTVGRVKGLY